MIDLSELPEGKLFLSGLKDLNFSNVTVGVLLGTIASTLLAGGLWEFAHQSPPALQSCTTIAPSPRPTTQSTMLTVSPERIQLPPGSTVTLHYQTWDDYETLLASRRDDAAIKICFNAHTQQISLMAPMAGHGRRIDTLVDLVKALLRHQRRDWDSSHPVTLKRLREAGAEPDACFYIQNWQAVLGKERIDLATDPPPDLAIEMDLTSVTELEIYQMLAVPEVWIYRQGQLNLYVLTDSGHSDRPTSLAFPTVDVKALLPQYVERAWAAGSSVALREFEQYLQTST